MRGKTRFFYPKKRIIYDPDQRTREVERLLHLSRIIPPLLPFSGHDQPFFWFFFQPFSSPTRPSSLSFSSFFSFVSLLAIFVAISSSHSHGGSNRSKPPETMAEHASGKIVQVVLQGVCGSSSTAKPPFLTGMTGTWEADEKRRQNAILRHSHRSFLVSFNSLCHSRCDGAFGLQ